MSAPEVVFDDVSKFYGEVLGVNRVTMRIPPGLTSLVGPNGSGKTTLMNLMTGLVRPDRGRIAVRGISPSDPERLMRITGYATQYDATPKGATGLDFVTSLLRLHGHPYAEAARLGGTVTGEHGVGVTSRDHLGLQRSAAYLDALRALKRALDPRGILNPGKIVLP